MVRQHHLGKRVDDDDLLFEVMSLQVFQAGLTWRMILNKRDGFRSAFDNWSISTVAGFGSAEVESLRNDPGIIRNRLKIQATVENARTVLALQNEHGSFCNWFYEDILGFDVPVDHTVLVGVGHGPAHLDGQFHGSLGREGSPGLHLAPQYPGDILHRHESGATFHLEVEDLDDVGVVQAGGQVGFLPQGHHVPGPAVPGTVDRPLPASGNGLQYLVFS
ncbi:MAG: DNA-3-methyladenine glycosylase I [Chloroflexota bacterium]|nr:DNA-3-methyladenine glycosylase I [Chloroflexota bacterium]